MNKIKYLIICAVLFLGCRHDLEKPGWKVDILAPVLNASLSTEDIIPDSLTNIQGDSLVELVFENDLASYGLKNLVPPFNNELQKTVKLNSIDIGNTNIVESISLGEVAKNAGTIGLIIIANHGNKSSIPPISDIPSSSYEIDANDFFESMTLEEGFLEINIFNEFPIEITDLRFELKNVNNGEVLVTDTVQSILPLETFSETYDLKGITVEGVIEASLLAFSSPGSNGQQVDIDTSDVIEISLNLRDLVPYEATAIFPKQTLANDTNILEFASEGNLSLVKMKLRSGYLKVSGISTIFDSVKFNYKIPNATKNGEIFELNEVIPPATEGSNSVYEKVFDFTGYDVDLTGLNGDTNNMFFDVFEASIDSSGQLAHLTLDDSIFLYTEIVDMLPDVGFGNLGQDTLKVGIDTIGIEGLDYFPSGTLTFNQADIKLNISNGLGANAAIEISEFSGQNSKDGLSKDLEGSILSDRFALTRANLIPSAPFVAPSLNTWSLNQSNSNIVDIININPDKLTYGFDLYLNPEGSTAEDNFIFYDYGVDAKLEFSLPLDLIAKQLILKDTTAISNEDDSNFNQIEEGIFNLIIDNEFPFSVAFKLLFLDEMELPLDSIIPSESIAAGIIGSDGKVNVPSRSIQEVFLDSQKIENLKNAKWVIYSATFNSNSSTPVKVFSHYQLKAKLIADVKYNFGK